MWKEGRTDDKDSALHEGRKMQIEPKTCDLERDG